MGKLKKAYLEEISAVDAVVEALEEALKSKDSEYQIVTNEGQPDESSEWISREKFLEFVIEHAVNELGGKVGYLFQDEKNNPRQPGSRRG